MQIRTITGDITPEALGVTNSHDHISISPPDWVRKKDPDLVLEDRQLNTQEMLAFKAAGGRSFVDCTSIDYGRNIAALSEIAHETGVQIIATSGFKEDPFTRAWLKNQPPDVDQLVALLVKEITVGVEETEIRCGVLKGSSSYNRISPLEETMLRVAARAHKTTGAPIVTHCTSGTMGLEQLDIFESEGVDLSRVCIGHCDLNPDPWYAKSIAARGAYVAYDSLGKVKYHPDSQRVEALRALVEAGHNKRILLGMDIGRQSDCKAYSGGIGHGWWLSKFIPRLRSEGFPENVIQDFLVENPKSWLAF